MADFALQTGSGIYGGVTGIQAGNKLNKASQYLTDMAVWQAILSIVRSCISMNQNATQINNAGAKSITEANTANMQVLGQTSGHSWAAADKVLQS